MVIPTYTLNEDLEDMAINAMLTYRDEVDELIVCEDGGNYSDEMRKIADIYIYSKKNVGFTKNINRGWKIASGDYTMLVNSDTLLFEGKLKDLCIPGRVTSPRVSGYITEKLFGGFFCVPKEIQEKYGYLDESFPMWGSDSDYEKKILDIYQTVSSVDVYHKGGATTNAAGIPHP